MRFYQDKIALRELFTRCNERRKDRRDERLTPLKRRILWSPCKNTLNGKGSHAWTATLHLYFLDSLQHVDSLHRPEFTKIRCYITKITDWISRLCFFKDISSSNCGKDTEVAKQNHNNSNFRILQEIFRECFFRFQIKTSSNCWLLPHSLPFKDRCARTQELGCTEPRRTGHVEAWGVEGPFGNLSFLWPLKTIGNS